MGDTDAWLAEADDILANWDGSADAATWSANGTHEHDTTGDYYALDGRSGGFGGLTAAAAGAAIGQALRAAMRFEATERAAEAVVVRIAVDASAFLRGIHLLMSTPLPRTQFTGTSRQYRTAKRRHARALRAHRKATR